MDAGGAIDMVIDSIPLCIGEGAGREVGKGRNEIQDIHRPMKKRCMMDVCAYNWMDG